MLGNSWFKKEKPLLGLTGMGGGADSKLVGGADFWLPFPNYLRPDDNGSYLVLAMPLNGDYTDYAHLLNGGATETSRTWSSSTGTGGIVEFQTSQYKFYNNAFRTYNGSGGACASTGDMTNSDFLFTTSEDFCVELWAYIDSNSSDCSLFGTAKDPSLPASVGGKMGVNVRGAGSGVTGSMHMASVSGTQRSPNNTWGYGAWHHYAVTRSGTTLEYWYDGTSVGSHTLTGDYPGSSYNDANQLILGFSNPHAPTSSTNKNTYINDVRVYKGVAKYTSAFTPPSSMVI